MRRLALLLLVAAFSANIVGAEDGAGESSGLDLFEQRIMPIFRSPKPSSCVQCHLSSVDLKDYILPSSEQTFASLREQGLVNVERPAESKILKLISMGEEDLDRGARLIHKRTRQAEYEAFAAWIDACCNDRKIRHVKLDPKTKLAKPATSDAVIKHNRKSRLADSFTGNIWSQRLRCFPCHTPHEIDENNPKHAKPRQNYEKLLKQYGQRMKIFRETPEATMASLLASSRRKSSKHLQLINIDNPRESLLILKPTAKLPKRIAPGKFESPSSLIPVTHMGGLKMHVDDQSYKSFVAWIQDYSQVVKGTYTEVEQLPSDNWFPSKHILRIRNAPEAWPGFARVQLFVHQQADDGKWSESPIAFTQGTLTPRRMVNGALFLLADADNELAKKWNSEGGQLPPGKYIIKAYVDSTKRLEKDPVAMLGKSDFAGAAVIDASWREGFEKAEVVPGAQIKK